MGEHVPGSHEAPGLIPSTAQKGEKEKKTARVVFHWSGRFSQ